MIKFPCPCGYVFELEMEQAGKELQCPKCFRLNDVPRRSELGQIGSDGVYRLGPLAVDVVGGVARVSGTDTIAGSTATMDRVFRFAVTHSGLAREDALQLAVRQASLNPARALGLPCEGLVPGAAADLVALDSELAVAGVVWKGSWVGRASGPC